MRAEYISLGDLKDSFEENNGGRKNDLIEIDMGLIIYESEWTHCRLLIHVNKIKVDLGRL